MPERPLTTAKTVGALSEPPFPVKTVATLSLCFLVNVYTVTSIFPYVAYYVVAAGAAEDLDGAGYWSGLVTGAFMVGRIVSAYPLGLASDRFGRKPVLVLGLVSISVLSLVFGTVSSVEAAICVRLLTGLLNGIPIVARTLATEVVARPSLPDAEQQQRRSRAVAWVLGSYSLGVVIGPAIGGLLAASPTLAAASPVFRAYPYLAPNLVTSVLAMALIPAVLAFVPETATTNAPPPPPRASRPEHAGLEASDELDLDLSPGVSCVHDETRTPLGSVEASGPPPLAREPRARGGVRSVLANPRAVSAIALYALYSGVEIGLTEVVCLWAVSTRESGGLGLTMHE